MRRGPSYDPADHGDSIRDERKGEAAIAHLAKLRANCDHPLVELLSTNGRNLDGAQRKCAFCSAVIP